MVSAKNNSAGSKNIKLNKDGSMRKKMGRKTLVNPSILTAVTQPELVRSSIMITPILDTQCENNFRNPVENMDMGNGKDRLLEIQDLRRKIREMGEYLDKREQNSSSSNSANNLILQKQLSKVINTNTSNTEIEVLDYKMKISKFNGGEDDDYDVWWEDLKAFFALHNYSENDKIRLFNAHLGGEARKFIQNEDLELIDTVDKLHELLRGTFSNKYDWQNLLMNMQQKPDEKIRSFSVRLRVAARKCGFQGPTLDNISVNYLKRSCTPNLKTILGNCLPGTPYDIIVEHAMQHERSMEVEQNEKKSSKRKSSALDEASSDENSLAKEK